MLRARQLKTRRRLRPSPSPENAAVLPTCGELVDFPMICIFSKGFVPFSLLEKRNSCFGA